jgi:pantoate--beta-alanine ligase
MGNLHDGHASLIRIAKKHAPRVAVSIFVNRLQFLPNEDFDRYPRTFERDCAMLEREGVEFLFAPDESVLYPEKQLVRVHPGPLGEDLEGRFRPGFFEGVATVVMKLFNCVRPRAAVFGKKDYQQLMVVRAMARQLDLPLEVVAGETVREADGLAMSSRNAYMGAEDRERAAALSRALRAAEAAARTGSLEAAIEAARGELEAAGITPEYLEARDPDDLTPVAELNGRAVLVAVAARVGGARLIDNVLIEPSSIES